MFYPEADSPRTPRAQQQLLQVILEFLPAFLRRRLPLQQLQGAVPQQLPYEHKDTASVTALLSQIVDYGQILFTIFFVPVPWPERCSCC
jgi:hypothetical protein